MGVTHMYHKCLIKVLLLFIKGFFSVFFRLSVFRTVEFFFCSCCGILFCYCFVFLIAFFPHQMTNVAILSAVSLAHSNTAEKFNCLTRVVLSNLHK